MSMRRLIVICALVNAAGFAVAQDQSAEGTRQLYYLATPGKDAVPPLPHTGGAMPRSASPAAGAGALHLGLRYNVVLMKSEGKSEQVPSDHTFKEGDCFAIDLQANRAAYLYVLARQSSGSWTPLPDMPGQKEAVPQGKRVRIPGGSCFVVHNPPGTETLFIVLSRDPKDFYELYESIKSGEGSSGSPKKSGSETQLAKAEKVDAAVEHLDEKFGGSRDITIAKVAEPTRSDEPKGAVYVVNTSQKPATSLVTKIEVRHR